MGVVLPRGKRSAVCLAFDWDAYTMWTATFDLASPTPLSRAEFGIRRGVHRILDLLSLFKIKSTFFIPGHTAEGEGCDKIVKRIHDLGHEIGNHGYTSENPRRLGCEEERVELERGSTVIERITGEKPVGYRSPAWDMSSNTIQLLVDHGYLYDSSMMGDDFHPYKCRIGDKVSKVEPFRFGKEVNLIEMPVTWGLDDFPKYAYVWGQQEGLASPSEVFEIWAEDFRYMYEKEENGVYILTMHPQITGRGHRMFLLEKLIRYMQGYPGIWFTSLKDVAETWED